MMIRKRGREIKKAEIGEGKKEKRKGKKQGR